MDVTVNVVGDIQQEPRKSVFERLGKPLTITNSSSQQVTRRIVTAHRDNEDLRLKVKRTLGDSSPTNIIVATTSASASSPPLNKNSLIPGRKSKNDDTKMKSLVLAPPKISPHSPSPTKNQQNVVVNKTCGINKLEDDEDDDEELERKRQQLKRELELEIEREAQMKTDAVRVESAKSVAEPVTANNSVISSRSPSSVGSTSGSYTSHTTTNGSYSKESESTFSENTGQNDHANSKINKHKTRNIDPYRVSSSPYLPNVTKSKTSNSKTSKPGDNVKLDRHGNVRVSLREKERQRLALESKRSPQRNRYDSDHSRAKKRPGDNIDEVM